MRWSRQNNRIALGWDNLGDLNSGIYNSGIYNSQKAVENAIRKFHLQNSNFKSGSFSLWNFYHEMKQGDFVILKGDKDNRVVEVTSDYYFDSSNCSSNEDYFHQRSVKFTQLDPQQLWRASGGMALDGGSIYRALIRCANKIEVP